MEYITYERYAKLGGKAPEAAFSALERKARHEVDYLTQNRLQDVATIEKHRSVVEETMVDLIDVFYEAGQGEQVSSFSNDGVSVSFAETKSTDDEAAQIIVKYLPSELLYLGVD